MELNLTAHDGINASISVQIMETKEDFFAAMYSNHVLNEFMVIIMIIGATFGLLLMSGTIWYERYGNHRCRTAINQLFSTLAWTVIGYILLVYIPEGIRYLKGPLSEDFCEFHNFMKNFFPSCFLLTLDGILLLRHIFIFKLSNFAVVNDDLIARFLNLSIVALSFWISIVKRFSSGSMPLNFHMCAGTIPNAKMEKEKEEHNNGKFNTTQILLCVSIILYAFILTKIFLYERKMEKKTQNINLGTIQASGSENTRQRKVAWPIENKIEKRPNLSKSMIDFTTQFMCLLFLVTFAILNYEKNATKPDELNEGRNWWYAYSQQAGLTIAISGISILYYGRNKHIASTIWRRILDFFRN